MTAVYWHSLRARAAADLRLAAGGTDARDARAA
jgi:hypothetical protein